MQRLILIALLALFTTTAFAQKNESSLIRARIKDGSIMVGGNLSGSYQKYESNNSAFSGRIINFDLMTKSGYFFLPDFGVGINLGVSHQSNSREVADGEESVPSRHTYLLGGPFLRYYWDNGLFAEANFGLGLDVTSGFDRRNLLSGAGGLGYAFFLTDNVTIEPMLTFNYYQITRLSGESKIKDSQFGPVFSIGLQAYLYKPTMGVLGK